ncbi:MAG TPA: hypothetical protein VNQ79_05545 [Blastocatellia bacterium]|nr:hypothetical protein [Blastocatellia bacterium]
MEDTFESGLSSKDQVELKKLIEEYLEAFRRIHEQMTRDQMEIDRLKAETWVMLDQMRKAQYAETNL